MIKVILTRGLPGSGKDTWAEAEIKKAPNSYKRVNKDLLRKMLDAQSHSEDMEKFIKKVRDSIIMLAIAEGKHIIVSDTNLSPKHENHIRQLVHGKAEVVIKDFTDVPVEECIRRDLKRFDSVGAKVIMDMYNQFLKPKPETIEYIEGLKNVTLCDLDGTLSLLNGRSPYDASTCENDILNKPVADIIKGRNIIFVSGREDKDREPTIRFLVKHGIECLELFMRKTGDFRKDAIIKKEIFDEHIRGKYNVDFVLDDRNQVVELWRSIGLTCLQVAEGNF